MVRTKKNKMQFEVAYTSGMAVRHTYVDTYEQALEIKKLYPRAKVQCGRWVSDTYFRCM